MTLEELESDEANYYLPVTRIHEKGYAMFIAHIFRVQHENKPSDWFIFELKTEQVKRICNY